MKLLVLADIHLDEYLHADEVNRLAVAIRTASQEADAMIVAGDLAEIASAKWPKALRWLGTLYPTAKTILIPGNHDYYGENIDTLDTRLDRICRDAGCAFGQCRTAVFGDTRVLITTLWTDMRLFAALGEGAVGETMWQARQGMPDYASGTIVTGSPERELRPKDTAAIHERQKAWLIEELEKPWSGRTIVVTHHCPSPGMSGPVSPLSPCFTSDLDGLIDRYRPTAWLFGHTHRPAERRAPGGTLLRNISLGYEYELCGPEMEARAQRGLIDLDAIAG